MKAARKKLTVKLRNKLFDEVRSTCPAPECKTAAGVSTLEIHHRDLDRDNNAEENLIALCPTCHTKATKGLISEADVDLWKRMLVRRHHPRLGPETAADLAKPAKRPRAKQVSFTAKGNNGAVHQAVTMTVNHRGAKRPVLAPALDSIAAHAAERSYIVYLRKEYLRCRLLEGTYDPKRRAHPTKILNGFKKAVGCDPLGAPVRDFTAVAKRAREVVAATVGARKYQNGFKPHDWEEHLRRFAN